MWKGTCKSFCSFFEKCLLTGDFTHFDGLINFFTLFGRTFSVLFNFNIYWLTQNYWRTQFSQKKDELSILIVETFPNLHNYNLGALKKSPWIFKFILRMVQSVSVYLDKDSDYYWIAHLSRTCFRSDSEWCYEVKNIAQMAKSQNIVHYLIQKLSKYIAVKWDETCHYD